MPQEDPERENGTSTNRPSMARSTLVPNTTEHAHRLPDLAANGQKQPAIPDRRNTPNGPKQQPALGGMESVRRSKESLGLSKEAAKLLTEGWREGTRAVYNTAWERWTSWCNAREIDPLQASLANITQFLTDLFGQGLQYSTINGYRSAMSAIHPPIDDHPVGQHPIITQIMAGVFNKRPPMPKYNKTWEVSTVLEHVKSLGPNESLTMKELTHKLTMLLALTAEPQNYKHSTQNICNTKVRRYNSH
jgi:hypothetical protein